MHRKVSFCMQLWCNPSEVESTMQQLGQLYMSHTNFSNSAKFSDSWFLLNKWWFGINNKNNEVKIGISWSMLLYDILISYK
jgi:hypothetical protein